MNTRFLIPTATALTLHALAFFGFTRTDPPRSQDDPLMRLPIPPARELVEIELPLATSDTKIVATGGKPDVTRSEEPPAPSDVSVFHPEIVVTRTATIPSTVIPNGVIGPGGDTIAMPGGTIVPSTALDNPPRTRSQIRPSYPFEAKQNGQRGEVFVEFTVDESGRVINPRVVRSTDSIFEVPTLNAVAKWRFEPGRRNGRTVRFRMAVPVEFSVND